MSASADVGGVNTHKLSSSSLRKLILVSVSSAAQNVKVSDITFLFVQRQHALFVTRGVQREEVCCFMRVVKWLQHFT